MKCLQQDRCLWTKTSKIDDFNEAEEKEIKKHIEKQKIKWREVAEKKQTFFFKKEENKETAKELWNRLSELNKEFKDIRDNKKN